MNKILDIEPGDRILISRSDKLGDLILALPFVESMKQRYPECRIEVLASLYASPILENNPSITRIVRVQNDMLLKDKLYTKDLLHRLKLAKYKVVVALYPERQISGLFYKAGIPHRIGTAGRFHSVLFNHRLFHSRRANKKHESVYNLDFLKFFLDGPTVHTPAVYPTEKELRNAKRVLRSVGVNGSFVVIHPGSGGSAECWPPERFLDLYSLLKKAKLEVVVSGSDKEGEMIDELAWQRNLEVKKITGETDLRTLAAVLSLASAVVANSTGPLHLAVAVGTKVVGLYPSKDIMSPVRWGPLGRGHQVVQPQVANCNCPPKQCRCMETISAALVAEKVLLVYRSAEKRLVEESKHELS